MTSIAQVLPIGMDHWDVRMLRLAREVASWSKDPSTQVGAVLARRNNSYEARVGIELVSTGYNGFPRCISDRVGDLTNRKVKYAQIVHAEVNAVLNREAHRCTLYTWPMPSCAVCVPIMLQAGVVRFVSMKPTADALSRWGESFREAEALINKGGRIYVNLDGDLDQPFN